MSNVLQNLPDGYEVVLGVFSLRDYDTVAERWPNLAGASLDAYIEDLEAKARSLQDRGADVEIAVIDLDEYEPWCDDAGVRPDHGDARARYITEADPLSLTYDDSVARVLEAHVFMEQAALAYALAADELDSDDVEIELEQQMHDLLDDVLANLNGVGLLSVETTNDTGDTVLGLNLMVTRDEDNDLCLVREADGFALRAAVHCGMLNGGMVYLRTLESRRCVLRAYDLGGRQWAVGTGEQVGAWRADRDGSVTTAGGVIDIRGRAA